MAWRNLLNIRRNPQLLSSPRSSRSSSCCCSATCSAARSTRPGTGTPVAYVDFLMPGIFVQTVTFGALTTGVGLAEDLQKGLIDRFRSLPMARSAVLLGRTWPTCCATSSSCC